MSACHETVTFRVPPERKAERSQPESWVRGEPLVCVPLLSVASFCGVAIPDTVALTEPEDRLRAVVLSQEELRQALATLQAHEPLERSHLDRYLKALDGCSDRQTRFRLLNIGGLSGDRRFREAMEAALDDASDPMSARISLLGLCAEWGETDRYRDAVLQFVRGVAWDDGDVRIAALMIAGQYLRKTDDDELLQALIDATDAEDYWVAQEAYQDLARMLTGASYAPEVVDAEEQQRLRAAARDRLRSDHKRPKR